MPRIVHPVTGFGMEVDNVKDYVESGWQEVDNAPAAKDTKRKSAPKADPKKAPAGPE